ncbi:Rieske 2Fe-2S domain-containing protein [Aquirufa rosea]|nr:Rieske 2Fe-2S domain-containing protein [Aquirufa rosea]
MKTTLNRNEFLKSLGFKGASLMAVYCAASGLSSCSKEENVSPASNVKSGTPATGVDFTLDLTKTDYSKLNNPEGFVIVNQIVIVRVNTNTFSAVTQVCSHEGNVAISYANGGFNCSVHGALYDINGKGLNAEGARGLTTYKTALTGTNLRVYS